ncbi:MAG: hypothetical protein OXH07_07235 [Chloroflexi bacterium]|nr:hypothetical protein [Chloroflexota bacterium]
MSSDAEVALLILAVTGGPFLGGFLLDTIFGTWARWWRWWLPSLLVGLLWVGLLIEDLVRPADNYDDLGRVGAHFVLAVVLVFAAVLASVGVGVRRLLGIWVAR